MSFNICFKNRQSWTTCSYSNKISRSCLMNEVKINKRPSSWVPCVTPIADASLLGYPVVILLLVLITYAPSSCSFVFILLQSTMTKQLPLISAEATKINTSDVTVIHIFGGERGDNNFSQVIHIGKSVEILRRPLC